MEKKIWMGFIQILTYRRDLINIIKPFMERLTNSKMNKHFRIQDEEYFPFLKLDNYQLQLLKKYEIITDELCTTLGFKEANKSLTTDNQLIMEIIKGDKFRELQSLTLEKDINSIKKIISSFQRTKMSIPIIIYSIIQNAIQCFKYLLINGYDPREIMVEQNPDPTDKSWKSSHRYEWNCMDTAIFYGRVEIIKILEDNGIEKGMNPNCIEAAYLSFRNSIAKEIMRQIKEKDETKIQEYLYQGLLASAKSNNIKGGEYLIKQGVQLKIENHQEPLHVAAIYNSIEMGELLILQGADIDSEGFRYLNKTILLKITQN